ncbi:MAG: hypothetical protein AB1813_23920 [Verrucomicrobiota bacterium]
MSEANLNYRGTSGAFKVRLQGKVRGTGGPYYPRLVFDLNLESISQESLRKVWLFQFQASLHCVGLGCIADSVPVQLGRELLGDGHPVTIPVCVEIPLDLYRVNAIESRRKDDIAFSLHYRLGCVTFWRNEAIPWAPPELEVLYQQHNVTIAQSDWVKDILPQLGFGACKVIEIPLGDSTTNLELGKATKALEDAHERLRHGAYDAVAQQCRLALEPFFEPSVKRSGARKKPKLVKSWETRLGNAADRWLNESVNAVRFTTNAGYRSGSGRFGRLEAEMLVMVTTALISYAAHSFNGD